MARALPWSAAFWNQAAAFLGSFFTPSLPSKYSFPSANCAPELPSLASFSRRSTDGVSTAAGLSRGTSLGSVTFSVGAGPLCLPKGQRLNPMAGGNTPSQRAPALIRTGRMVRMRTLHGGGDWPTGKRRERLTESPCGAAQDLRHSSHARNTHVPQ